MALETLLAGLQQLRAKWNEDQDRDSDGRWSSGGGGNGDNPHRGGQGHDAGLSSLGLDKDGFGPDGEPGPKIAREGGALWRYRGNGTDINDQLRGNDVTDIGVRNDLDAAAKPQPKKEKKEAISPIGLQFMVASFDWQAWRKAVEPILSESVREVILSRAKVTAGSLGITYAETDPWMSQGLTDYVGRRIVELENTTKARVSEVIRAALDKGEGLSLDALGDTIAEAVRTQFDGFADWRADRIARSETAISYNLGDLLAWRAAGITQVEVQDGDGDEPCAKADGQVWDIDYAIENPIEHPNCTRTFSPVEPDDPKGLKEFNEDQERDEQGRWTSSGAAATVSALDQGDGHMLVPFSMHPDLHGVDVELIEPQDVGLTVEVTEGNKFPKGSSRSITTIDPRGLIATQQAVSINSVRHFFHKPPVGINPLPKVYERDGKRYIFDGHHRLAADLLAGRQSRVYLAREKVTK